MLTREGPDQTLLQHDDQDENVAGLERSEGVARPEFQTRDIGARAGACLLIAVDRFSCGF